ncbi:MAG: hypothetical protein JWN13_2457 [Betaproteobacteria bacterium]|nr:hypothetical protein [Betaproteobacteria bacterium]
MPESDKLAKLKEYHALVKQVLAVADKEVVEEVARILAAHFGYYQRRYGQVSMEETLASLHTNAPTDEQIADSAEGMQTLVAVLMLATGVADDQEGKA